MPDNMDISNKQAVFRIDIAGIIAVLVLCIGGISSHVTLANDQKHTSQKVEKIEAKIDTIEAKTVETSKDVAAIKASIEMQQRQLDRIEQHLLKD